MGDLADDGTIGVNRALILFGFAVACRRSELVALDVRMSGLRIRQERAYNCATV
jgi:hypothetical protein